MTITNRPPPPATGQADADDEDDLLHFNTELVVQDPVHQKLADAQTSGYQAEFDPAEAEAAGAFIEDALTETDALDSAHDNAHVVALPPPRQP